MKYFLLQCKRVFRYFPFVIMIIAILFSVFFVVFSRFVRFMGDEQNNRFRIGVVGETDNRFFEMGISAVQTFDTSRFSIDVAVVDEETAKKELRKGTLSAYVVIPDGFTRAIEYGKIMPISYYTTQSSLDVTAIMKDEITAVISDFLKESQKGVFAVADLLDENGYENISNREMNELNIEYIDFILDRSKMYKTDITGVSSGLSMVEYLIIGLTVTFACIFIIPFACLFVKEDRSFIKLFHASGRSITAQIFAEYFSLFIGYISVFAVITAAVAVVVKEFKPDLSVLGGIDLVKPAIGMIPVTALISALAFFVFELAGNTVSAVTGYFFGTCALCYISGCMYPIYALPTVLQKAAQFTPTGAARVYLTGMATDERVTVSLLTVLLYAVLFIDFSAVSREYKLKKGDGLYA